GLLAGAAVLLVGGYFLRAARLKRRELRDLP
ncbi:MAG: hypothetical protein JWO82_469, partial [Akkermansiaceae bacterium]|nr:hypothetical protein [Akkermansiaceae bacterium]